MPVSEWSFPSANVTSLWTTNAHTNLDRSTVPPGMAPSTSTYIEHLFADGDENQEYSLSVPTVEAFTAIASMNVYVYAEKMTSGDFDLNVEVRVNGGSYGSGTQTFSSPAEWLSTSIVSATTRAALQSQFSVRLSGTPLSSTLRVYAVAVEVVYAGSNTTVIYADPISNVISNWTTNTYANIDDGIRFPSTPTTADYVEAVSADQGETQAWAFPVPSSRVYQKVRFVEAWVHMAASSAFATYNNGTIKAKYGNGLTSTSTIAMANVPVVTGGWRVFKWKVDETVAAFASTLQIEMVAPTPIPSPEWFRVYALYVKFVYEDVGKRLIVRPIANAVTLWNRYDYGFIDDPAEQPNSTQSLDGSPGGIFLEAFANKADDNEEQVWELGDPGNRGAWTRATQVKVWLYVLAGDAGTPAAEIRLKVGASWSSYQTISNVTSNTWVSYTFSGTWTQADFDTDFLVAVKVGTHATADNWMIHSLYAEVTTDLRQVAGAFV